MRIEINIDDLNALMEACIYHGGDPGGPYMCNEDGVREVLRKISINNGMVYAFKDEWPIVLRYHKEGELAGEAKGTGA